MKRIRDFKPDDRFLSLNVYKFPLGNCGGITDHMGKDCIYIPHPEGPTRLEDIYDERHIFIPEQRGFKDSEYWAVKPNIQPSGVIGPMAGGNLAYSSDSRCTRVYHIHDRFETPEQYKTLST